MQIDFNGHTKDRNAIERIISYSAGFGYVPHVQYSGGKDSDVLLHLVVRSRIPFVAEYKVTGIDPYPLVRHIKQDHPEVIRIRPEKTIWELIKKKQMPPMRMKRYCCEYLKENNPDNTLLITGVRWQESFQRRHRQMYEVCRKNKTSQYLHPIIDWSEFDVWQYIQENNIKTCELYKQGFKRLGCVLCPMHTAKQRKLEIQLFPEIANKWKRAIDNLHGCDFNWWISDESKVSDAQCTMFHD